MRRLLVWSAMILAGVSYAGAQILSPIIWNVTSSMTSDTEGEIVFSATIEDGWHLYGLNLPEGGPKATSIDFEKLDGMTL
ncbi:MAG: thiol:disulfide interchange protein, partial [Paramuribaculum sp.]|nr:thiol:disulfide interchange protein [Paramuribaculum sp.]